jgi:hypothetical protein
MRWTLVELKTRFITYLLDHVHKFSLGGVLSKGSHDSAKLLGCDGACMVVWED